MPRRCSVFATATAMLLGLFGYLFAAPARAYEEQVSLDVALGYGVTAASETLPRHLTALDVGAAGGLSDWLVLRGALGYGLALEPQHATLQLGRARVELAYLVDILQWVPFFGLGAGLWIVERAQGGASVRPAAHVVFGLDYLVSRAWTVGIDVRTGFSLSSSELASFTEAQLRLSRMFELF